MNRNNSFNHRFNRTASHSPQQNNYCQKILISNYIKASNKIPSSLNSSINSNKDEQNELMKIKNKYKELLRENEQLKFMNSINKRSGSGVKKIVNTHSLIKNLTQGNLKKNMMLMNSINSTINSSKRGKSLNIIKNNNKNHTIEKGEIQFNNFVKKEGEVSGTLSNINLELSSSFNINNNNNNNQNQNTNNNLNTINNQSNINLANLVLNFLKQMKDLQDSISKKLNNIHEMKKNFEIKKRELKKTCESIINNSNSNQHIITNNSVNISPRSFQNKKFIQQTPEKDNNNKQQYEEIIDKLKQEIKKLNEENKIKEEKLKNEKIISSLKEEKLNTEKIQNKTLNDQNEHLKIQINELNSLIISQKETIDGLTSINEAKTKQVDKYELLEKDKKNLKDSNDNLLKENKELKTQIQEKTDKINELTIQSQLNNNNNKDSEKIKNLENEISNLKLEITNYKLKITEHNKDIISLTNNNQSLIREKDKIINELSNNIKDLNGQIDNLNKDILNKQGLNNENKNEEIQDIKKNLESFQEKNNELNKENRQLKNKIAEIKTQFIAHDEDLINLKKDLVLLNIESNSKINDIKDKNQKIENIKNDFLKNLQSNDLNNKIDNSQLKKEDILNEINSNISTYSQYIDLFKEYNKDFQLNK